MDIIDCSYPYYGDSSIHETYFRDDDDDTRLLSEDPETFGVNYNLAWSHYYYVRLSLSFPDEIQALVERYFNSRHWWADLCHFTPMIMLGNVHDKSMLRDM